MIGASILLLEVSAAITASRAYMTLSPLRMCCNAFCLAMLDSSVRIMRASESLSLVGLDMYTSLLVSPRPTNNSTVMMNMPDELSVKIKYL